MEHAENPYRPPHRDADSSPLGRLFELLFESAIRTFRLSIVISFCILGCFWILQIVFHEFSRWFDGLVFAIVVAASTFVLGLPLTALSLARSRDVSHTSGVKSGLSSHAPTAAVDEDRDAFKA